MRVTGRLKVYDPVKGFGFITVEKGKEVFVNYQEFDGASDAAVVTGLLLEFDLVEAAKGPRARNVKIVG
uniref:cold shock domain-containing protein n=1 Tax=Caballeronia sp. LjRoot34 TaxID=3342325 RepID=UPI003F4FC05F